MKKVTSRSKISKRLLQRMQCYFSELPDDKFYYHEQQT